VDGGSPNAVSAFDGEMASGPQTLYHLMEEAGPVIRADIGTVLVHHDDVQHALRHPDLFSSREAVQIGNVRPLIPLGVDPPDHVKYRRILDPLFAPKAIAPLEAEIRSLVTELIDGFIDDGEVEFNTAFAIPLPCTVFLRLLGLPLDDLDLFLRLKDNIIRPEGRTLDQQNAVRAETGREIYAYFNRVIDERAAEPRQDLMSRFLATEVDGHRLSREDILDTCYLFLLAGLDTVTATLGCSVVYLANHPDHRRALSEDPSLIPAAVEELLRWETPVPGIMRIVAEDVEVRGEVLKAGEQVTCMLGSANLDPDEFPEPDKVDFARQPNRHLAFGAGVHRCLGSHLGRLEMRVALEELHKRIPDYEIKPGETPRYGAGIRTVEYLPLVFTPSGR
jgi:cytochrome P450